MKQEGGYRLSAGSAPTQMRAHIDHRLNLQTKTRDVSQECVVGNQMRCVAVPRVTLADRNADVGNRLLRIQIVQRPPQVQAPIGSDREPVARPDVPAIPPEILVVRSEERRVGKECRSRWSVYKYLAV